MKPIYRLILAFAVYGLIAPLVFGQAVLEKTTLGSSQNDYRDLENSLIVPKRTHIGKEKKEEVDLRTLQTKASHDPTFGGSLVEMGLGSSGDPTLRQQKQHSITDQKSNASKPAEGVGEKDSKASQQTDTSGDKDSKASKSTQGGDDQNKDRKAKSSASDEKPSEKEKAAASKPDGDR
jgi:hypothetical protein